MPRYTIQAVGVYGFVLVLNPMMGNTENYKEFGPFDTKDELMAFYNGEKVDSYSEIGPDLFGSGKKTYNKTFRKGGPLEWMNPLMPTEFDTPGHHGHGVHEILLRVEDAIKLSPAF